MSLRRSFAVLMAFWVAPSVVTAADEPVDPNRPTDAARAAQGWTLPAGFGVSLFAAEPQVRQPIGIAFDGRGRLWVAENDTYADQAVGFDLKRHDRIVILEDTDHDGKADKRTVFHDGLQRLTSVEIGFGGVWALCAPHLVFIPDADGDDRPDGPPVVVLDGWDAQAIRHNIVNGLKWGPDGWLYGRHGILATSKVGAPGTPDERRALINTGVWRYHPTRKTFEVVCRGTTNPWGLDWNERGEAFFINTVIGHLWHVLPGAHYQRMYGDDFNPNLYGLMPQTADHFHWDTAEVWSDIRKIGVSPTTDQAGGGHAHSGLMCYLGDNWPERHRGHLFTINLHGRRLNDDRITRAGAGFVVKHEPDFAKTSDPWFRAVELAYGPDGGVYVADWSDVGECHENDGVHRQSGRIFKIVHGKPAAPHVPNVAALDDSALVGLQSHKNEWYARQARRVLQERAASGKFGDRTRAALEAIVAGDADVVRRLRALWCLNAIGGASEQRLMDLLDDRAESMRSWAVRLLVDGPAASPAAASALARRAGVETSGLVLLYLASALQKMQGAERWAIARALAAHAEFAADPVLPLMVWYGVEPVVPADPKEAVELAATGKLPTVTRFIARRLMQGSAADARAVETLLPALTTVGVPTQRAILEGLAEGLRGRRSAPRPDGWDAVSRALGGSTDDEIRQSVRDLAVVFGDERAIDEVRRVAISAAAPAAERRRALGVLVETRSPTAIPVLVGLLDDKDIAADAVRGLSAFRRPETTNELLKRYASFTPAARAEVVSALASRPDSAAALLDAVEKGAIGRDTVSLFQLRQIQSLPGEDVKRRLSALWPELRPLSSEKRERIAELKARLTGDVLRSADLAHGRALFSQTCIQCHTLFGEGAKVGPDLTGSQRSNLDYLLENIVDPSGSVAAEYRMTTVALADGRVLNGVVGGKTERSFTLQTPSEKLVIPLDEVEDTRPTNLSLMPEGQLDVLKSDQVRDLIGYLMSPAQVPLPAGAPTSSPGQAGR